MTFVTLNNHNDYEISTSEPWIVRRSRDHHVISDKGRISGCPVVSLNCKHYFIHQLVAEQFIPNEDPERLTKVMHLNGNNEDNSIANLQWCTFSDIHRGRRSFKGSEATYIQQDDMPKDIIPITQYGKHQLESIVYSLSKDTYYEHTTKGYRVMPVRYNRGDPYVATRDVNRKKTNMYISVLNKTQKQ